MARRQRERKEYKNVQLRLSLEAAETLDRLTSPRGKGTLIEGLLRFAESRRKEIDAKSAPPLDALSELLIQERERKARSAKRKSGKDTQEDGPYPM